MRRGRRQRWRGRRQGRRGRSWRGAHPLRVEELRLVDGRVALRDHDEHVVARHELSMLGQPRSDVAASDRGATHPAADRPGVRVCPGAARARRGARRRGKLRSRGRNLRSGRLSCLRLFYLSIYETRRLDGGALSVGHEATPRAHELAEGGMRPHMVQAYVKKRRLRPRPAGSLGAAFRWALAGSTFGQLALRRLR